MYFILEAINYNYYKPQISLPVAFRNFPPRSREKDVLTGKEGEGHKSPRVLSGSVQQQCTSVTMRPTIEPSLPMRAFC